MKRKRRYRVKKPFYRNKNFWIFFLLFFLSFFLLYFFLFSDFFLTKEIQLIGLRKIKKEEMERMVRENLKQNFLKKENLLLLNPKEIENKILKSFPRVENVKVSKKFPRKILIEIKEREDSFLICSEKCYSVDRKGIVIGESEEKNLLKIEGLEKNNLRPGEKIFPEDLGEKILKIKVGCDELKIEIEKVSILNEKLEFQVKENWKLIFDPEKDVDFQLKKLKIIWEKLEDEKKSKLEYIDLRFGNLVFPKYKD